jgi:hypothetical protein
MESSEEGNLLRMLRYADRFSTVQVRRKHSAYAAIHAQGGGGGVCVNLLTFLGD